MLGLKEFIVLLNHTVTFRTQNLQKKAIILKKAQINAAILAPGRSVLEAIPSFYNNNNKNRM